jgi:5-deoxy-D-glucuronate isomerase
VCIKPSRDNNTVEVKAMSDLLINNPAGFKWGFTPITTMGEAHFDTGINFGILKLKKGETRSLTAPLESAYLLISGNATFRYDGKTVATERLSLFDEAPVALHLAAGSKADLSANSDCELAVFQVENDQAFAPCLFDAANMLENEHRGKGLLQDTAYRIVRTIFDFRNRPEAKLVLGEVVNFPGRWSSYPPHHHPQPEVYHYRFTKPQGYGHGEVGNQVFMLHQNDTLKIPKGKDHSQVSAPGYGMYYIWVIRHLPENPYIGPEFTPAHEWTLAKDADVWHPDLKS